MESFEFKRVEVEPGISLATWMLRGSGTPFLLVHGLSSNARLYDGVAHKLSELGHHCVSLDQRGHGQSDKPDSGYDFKTITDDLHSVIVKLSLKRAILVGQSWGGNVVLEHAKRFPSEVAGIALIDGGWLEPSFIFDTWEECSKVLAPPNLAGTSETLLKKLIQASHRDWSAEAIEATMANMEVLSDGTVRPWLGIDNHMQILRALYDHHPSKIYQDIGAPVLLIPAESARENFPGKRNAIDGAENALKKSKVHWFSPADHDVHAQHPKEVANLLHAQVVEGFFDR
ncbi:MAG: alpha/beta hydrolase [Acidimicrobiales bacterium]|nr:alpha/beta hydrolase [Acidimicrobiales bacterium]